MQSEKPLSPDEGITDGLEMEEKGSKIVPWPRESLKKRRMTGKQHVLHISVIIAGIFILLVGVALVLMNTVIFVALVLIAIGVLISAISAFLSIEPNEFDNRWWWLGNPFDSPRGHRRKES